MRILLKVLLSLTILCLGCICLPSNTEKPHVITKNVSLSEIPLNKVEKPISCILKDGNMTVIIFVGTAGLRAEIPEKDMTFLYKKDGHVYVSGGILSKYGISFVCPWLEVPATNFPFEIDFNKSIEDYAAKYKMKIVQCAVVSVPPDFFEVDRSCNIEEIKNIVEIPQTSP